MAVLTSNFCMQTPRTPYQKVQDIMVFPNKLIWTLEISGSRHFDLFRACTEILNSIVCPNKVIDLEKGPSGSLTLAPYLPQISALEHHHRNTRNLGPQLVLVLLLWLLPLLPPPLRSVVICLTKRTMKRTRRRKRTRQRWRTRTRKQKHKEKEEKKQPEKDKEQEEEDDKNKSRQRTDRTEAFYVVFCSGLALVPFLFLVPLLYVRLLVQVLFFVLFFLLLLFLISVVLFCLVAFIFFVSV